MTELSHKGEIYGIALAMLAATLLWGTVESYLPAVPGVESELYPVQHLLAEVDLVVVMGTELGVKGIKEPEPRALDTMRALDRLRKENRRLHFEIEADGAVRDHTVGSFREAGADIVLPGSLLFGGDIAQVSARLRAL